MLCRQGAAWAACQVQRRDERRCQIVWAASGREDTLPREQTVDVPSELRSWVSRGAEQQLAAVRARKELDGLRPVTAGQQVAAGQHVLATWTDGNWYAGEVLGVERDQAVIEWADGTPPHGVLFDNVAPLPKEPTLLEAGSLAVCRWQSGARWWRAKVEAVVDGKMAVVYIDRTRGELAPGECVPATR